ncbi:MAG TPA: hypothetical protein VNA89_09530 [Gemmatimonadaceae bacterium]|nr:hypothetical protein [Gemmatimonadaceae bacterium]
MEHNLNAPDGRFDGEPQPARQASETERLTDREVPLGNTSIPATVHAWLDGEMPESAARAESKRDVEFWQKLNAETAQRRQIKTPTHVQAQIMAALPQSAPTAITPWWRREFVVQPGTAAAAAGGLILLGAAISAVVIRTID